MNSIGMYKKELMLIIALLVLSASAVSQTFGDSTVSSYRSICQSTWRRYDTINEEFSIVRSNRSNYVAYVRKKESLIYESSSQMLHTFIVRNETLERTFTTTFNCLPGFEFVEISDMRLFEDTCYFCGTYSPPKQSENSKRGFVGHFVTTEILNGDGTVYYQIVDTVKCLTRLAISKSFQSPLVISAIGQLYKTNAPCIIELHNGVNAWKIVLDTIFENYGMVFSDIMTVRDSLTLLAQFECSNDNLVGSEDYDFRHQIFLLDRFGLSGCSLSYNPSWIHYMAHYLIPANDDYKFHHDKAPMRLFHINDHQNEFGVAFGVEENNELYGGVRLFRFPNGWNFSRNIYYRTGRHAEIKDIGNLYMFDTIYMLTQDDLYPKGRVSLLSMTSPYSTVRLLANSENTYNSLIQKFVGRHIDISGHGPSVRFHLFDQDVSAIIMPSCFDVVSQQYEVMANWKSTQLGVHWEFATKENFYWEKADITYIQPSPTVICSECN